MKTNRASIDLIKSFEGLRLHAYKCPAGIWTVGYGHTSAAGPPKVEAGMKITADEAGEILIADLLRYEMAVVISLDKFANENQFAAMVSLCYNIGPGNFKKSSVVRYFNAGQPAKAADAFMLWNKITDPKTGRKIFSRGLDRRRRAERDLFLKPVQNVIPERVQPPSPPVVEDHGLTSIPVEDHQVACRDPQPASDGPMGWAGLIEAFLRLFRGK